MVSLSRGTLPRAPFLPGQLPAQGRARQVNATVIERAGNIGEVDPFKETMRSGSPGSEPFTTHTVVLDDDHLARFQGMHFLEAQVQERHAFAGGGEQRSFLRIAKRPKPLRIAGDGHVAHGIEKHDVVRPVEFLAEIAENLHKVGTFIAAQSMAEIVENHFRVGVASQVVISQGKQVVAQLGVIRQLSVEGEAEPLPFAAVVPIKRLGIVRSVGPQVA